MMNQHHLLGRETYLAPVEWETGSWPVVNGDGQLFLSMDVPTLEQYPLPEKETEWDFSKPLGPEWSYLRNPEMERYRIHDGKLSLYGSAYSLNTHEGSTTFVGYRQQDIIFSAESCLELKNAKDGDEAGISLYMDIESHFDIFLSKKGNKNIVTARCHLGTMDYSIETKVPASKIWLKVSGDYHMYYLSWSTDGKNWNELGQQKACFFSSETNWGFTGIMIGLYAYRPSEDGTVTEKDFHADFDYFKYSVE